MLLNRLSLFATLVAGCLLAGSAVADVKFTVPADAPDPQVAGAELIADYGSYRLYRAPQEQAGRLADSGVRVLDRADWLLFDAGPFDTRQGPPAPPQGFQPTAPEGAALQMIQFAGPIRSEWLDQVRDAGATPIHYVANHGYLVWADDSARTALDQMAANRDVVQFSAPYPDHFKFGPAVRDKAATAMRTGSGSETIPVTVQIVDHPNAQGAMADIAAMSRGMIQPFSPILKFHTGRFEMALSDLDALAARPDVYWIEEYLPRELFDEIQNQIIAANFNGDQSQPSGTGYLAFLDGLGFPAEASSYPVVDVVDDGIGDGNVVSGDPTLHVGGDDGNATRLAYVSNCTGNASGESVGGHGHINTSIVGGYDARAGFPFQDPDGFQRGQGVNPYGLVAGTRIFGPGFDLSNCGGSDTGLIQHTWQQGARISTNSWGCRSCAGSYDDSSQAFDVGTRDADPSNSVNEELFHVFAAGNDGPGGGTVGTPGNGKNMLTVGASENYRPDDEDGDWTDGCGTSPSGADNAMDVIGFSSRGPSPGNRVKPETIAPGTHIQGTASTSPSYSGGSVCDQFRPSGQSDFAASSGTSHSTPAVAGLSSLAWWWLQNEPTILPGAGAGRGDDFTPTPALMKAYILAHPTYLTGTSANDTLPSNAQGYGMPNMQLLFNDTPKMIVNQNVVFTDSGATWEWIGSAADPSEPVRVMLVWTDQAGAIGTSPQVNDLNLQVGTGGETYLGNEFDGQWSVTGGSPDTANNYEAVFLPDGSGGEIQITVEAFNIAGDGVPNNADDTDQDFAIVCYNCIEEPTFTVQSDPGNLQVCTPDDAIYDLTIGSILDYTETVTLAATGNPASTTAAFSENPVTPPGTSQLTIGNTGAAAAGEYTISIEGTTADQNKTTEVDLRVFTETPQGPGLVAPDDEATEVGLVPTLEWNTPDQATDYLVEVATDAGFGNLVFSTTTSQTSATLDAPLEPVSTYYWRVRADNLCGQGAVSDTRSFTTRSIPPVLLVDDDDNDGDVQPIYTAALDALDIGFDVWDTGNSDNEPEFATLAQYRSVIWFTGDEFGGAAGPGPDGEAALGQFLDVGGCLLLSSQDYHWDRDLTPFMTDYLGVSDVDAETDSETAEGVGDFFGGLGIMDLDHAGVGLSNFGDSLVAGNGGEAILLGDDSNPVATIGPSGRAIWSGVALAVLAEDADLQAVLQIFANQVCPLEEIIFADEFESAK